MLKAIGPYCGLLVVVSVSLIVGCSDSGRLPIKGKVTVDGTPVENGYVYFSPLPGTKGPTAGAKIAVGIYEVDPSKGLFEGEYQVAIKVWQESNRMTEDFATGERVHSMEQVLPSKFNSKSELTVEIQQGRDSYDFLLEL